MIARRLIFPAALFVATAMCVLAGPATGQERNKQIADSASAAAVPASSPSDEAMRLDGEKRFSANCGRCHQSPHKFPPRMMATIIRHMRVRATITDEDMRLILRYMTQ